jgi:predicted membrane-bound spermidine synthase
VRAYAVVEALVGLGALAFHPLFLAADDLAFSHVLPLLGTAGVWAVAAALVLPPALLIGATWPMLAGAAVRRGGSIGAVYFANTAGAAVGALACGPLVATFDLPGAMAAAGAVDLLVAALAWTVPQVDGAVAAAPAGEERVRGLYAAALFTGLASFAYEIAWTRMLAMVLGSSTRAFELMLGAFLIGLAFGGLAVRRWVTTNPVRALAIGQVAMGLCALASLVLYDGAFDAMAALLASVDRTPLGWGLYSAGATGIALLVMLPATLCAGTTLPLVSAALLRTREGESALGRAWAANTVGGIVGILLSVHVGLPMLGLKGLLLAAAGLDLAVGVGLASRRALPAGVAIGALGIVGFGVELSPLRMASGVYRTGELLDPATTDVLFAHDGRTASVAVTREGPLVTLRTNGKPDAGLRTDATAGFDEHTMILLGALPVLLRPDARRAANIGLGSGLTTNTLLASPTLAQLDTVEIEPAMVAGARLFGDRVARTFTDPRSALHLADARTFFAGRDPYDIVVSEPSNPWVSGVAGLFSTELYARSRGWLAPGGVLVQWLQAYEIDDRLLASVLRALSESYQDWEIWAVNDGDLVVVACADGPVPALHWEPALAPDLARIGIHDLAELQVRRVGNRRALEPLLAATGAPANSDFAPVLEIEAPRALFYGVASPTLMDADLDALPAVEMLGGVAPGAPVSPAWTTAVPRVPHRILGRTLFAYLQGADWDWVHPDDPVPDNVPVFAEQARIAFACGAEPVGEWVDGMFLSFALRTLPHLTPAEAHGLLDPLGTCSLEPVQRDLVALLTAITDRDAAGMSALARAELHRMEAGDPGFVGWLVGAGMLGDLASGRRADARALWEAEAGRLDEETRANVLLRLLRGHAEGERFGVVTQIVPDP